MADMYQGSTDKKVLTICTEHIFQFWYHLRTLVIVCFDLRVTIVVDVEPEPTLMSVMPRCSRS